MLPGVPGQLVLHPCARVPVRQDEQIYQNKYMSNHTDQENHNGKISSYEPLYRFFVSYTSPAG